MKRIPILTGCLTLGVLLLLFFSATRPETERPPNHSGSEKTTAKDPESVFARTTYPTSREGVDTFSNLDLDDQTNRAEALRQAIHLSAQYLVNSVNPDGSFVYRINLDPSKESKPVRPRPSN